MVRTTTHNIEVTVEVKYWPQHSIPKENHYFFVYFVSIENQSDYSVQLLRRTWTIADAGAEKREVEGEGVVGETPVLEPGQRFEYNSGCNLLSEIGFMEGYYTFIRTSDEKEFHVEIPRFDLIVPSKLN